MFLPSALHVLRKRTRLLCLHKKKKNRAISVLSDGSSVATHESYDVAVLEVEFKETRTIPARPVNCGAMVRLWDNLHCNEEGIKSSRLEDDIRQRLRAGESASKLLLTLENLL